MKKILVTLSLLLAFLIPLGACGDASTGSDPAGTDSSASADSATNDQDVLMVYTPQADTERGPWIKEQAEKALGFKVEFLAATGGELSERMLAERSNPQADVIMGLTQTAMYQIKDEGLLKAYTPSWAEGLPDVYKDKDGIFFSYWQTPIIIAYNPAAVPNPPSKWEDLTKDEFKATYGIGNTASQTIRTYILGMLWPYYDEATGDIKQEGWDMLKVFFENAYEVPSEMDYFALLKEDKLKFSLNWFGGAKAKAKQFEVEIDYVKPVDGTPIVAEGIALVNGSKHEEKAKKFIEWWGSKENMSAYANQFAQAPAHPDAIALCNDEIKAEAQMFKAQNIDWEICSKNIDKWFEKIELEIKQ